MITKAQAVSNFLKDKAKEDLSVLYSIDMECQVNVARDNGEPIEGEFRGKKWKAWTDGTQQWKSFRIPFNASTKPHYEDSPMNYDLSKHVEGIGMTGWNWKNLESRWVAFDFDAIVGHSELHSKKLNDDELKNIVRLLSEIPWVQIRKSSSGKGLHVYVFLDPYVHTENHHEHAALARAILSKLSSIVAFDFNSKADGMGSNIWVWHRKMLGTDGFELIKDKTENLSDVPTNWKDHIKVITGAKKRITPDFIVKSGEDTFEELCGQYLRIELDEEHKKLLDFLKNISDGASWWDTDRHMLVTHTVFLKEAHASLNMRGIFDTLSTGRERGTDHNVFMNPLRKGGWVVRRFTPGCAEKPTWTQDKSGWTTCYLNKEPDLSTAARGSGGVDLGEGKGYQFREAEIAARAAEQVGAIIKIPVPVLTREAVLREQKDGKLVIEIERQKNDNPAIMEGWANVKNKWKKILDTSNKDTHELETPICDDQVRHVVTELERSDMGWFINSEGHWQNEPLAHVRPFLKSQGHSIGLIEPIIGLCIQRAWRVVNRPFQPEYIGNRDWNLKGAKLRFIPNPNKENLNCPSWMKILTHVGESLDSTLKKNPWAIENGIITGADYLKCWIASMFQKPYEPLPYLFLFGPQDCGKSIFYEALRLLFDRGHVEANNALLNRGDFNGELANAILCFIEEVDLSKAKYAYNRVKNWVTSKVITIHEKGETPFQLPNTTKWIQVANNHSFCPSFTGDTRITMIEVSSLDEFEIVPKHILLKRLEEEAPDFLASVLDLELPEPISRLSIPVITTAQKMNIENQNKPIVEQYLIEKCFYAPGVLTLWSDLFESFNEWLPTELRHEWNKVRFGREFPSKYPRGYHTDNKTFVGNISLSQNWDKTDKVWTLNEKGKLEVQK